MSIMLMSRIFRMNIGGCNRKLLAVRLADFADDDGRGIYPGVERLSLETELSERTVQRILADFEKEGILICRQRASGRPGVANRYDFDLERLFAYDAAAAKAGSKPETGDSVSPVSDAETGDNRDERGDNGDIEGCHGDTRTVIEPPLEPSSEREGASEREEGEDRKAIERAYWALVKDWPGFAGMPKEPALKDWMRLTAEERHQAADRFPAWLVLLKAQKKSHVPAPSTYLRSKLWTDVAGTKAETARPALHTPFSKAWSALRIAELLKPAAALPAMTKVNQMLVERGGDLGARIQREHLERYGWPKVSHMHERAARAEGVVIGPRYVALSDGFERVHVDSARAEAWRRLHMARGWPWLPDMGKHPWLYFPAAEGDGDGDVAAALARFEQAVEEVRGNEHAA